VIGSVLLAMMLTGTPPADPFKVPPVEAPPAEAPGAAGGRWRVVDQPVGPREVKLTEEERARVSSLGALAARIESIDPENEDFNDLEPIAGAIGDRRVVFLGEPTHGHGSSILAKARLVRFLHQRMGFDVLVFESGVFDCRFAHELLLGGAAAGEAFERAGLMPWARSLQNRALLDYVRLTYDTERPLEFAGYDAEVSDADGGRAWPEAVRAFVAAADHPIAARGAEIERRLLAVTEAGMVLDERRWALQRERLRTARDVASELDAARDALIEAHGAREHAFMRRSVDNVIAGLSSNMVWSEDPSGGGQQRGLSNARDARMGENLIWLARERYADRKLIVWAATFHGVHAIREIEYPGRPRQYETTIVAGGPSKAALGDELYTIAVTAHEGRVARVLAAAHNIGPSPRGSFEWLLAQVGHPFLFVHFAGLPEDHWLRGAMLGRLIGPTPRRAVWPDQVDAALFTRWTWPVREDVRVPAGRRLTAPIDGASRR